MANFDVKPKDTFFLRHPLYTVMTCPVVPVTGKMQSYTCKDFKPNTTYYRLCEMQSLDPY